MSKPSISYILLSYNQANTIAEAVESALAQEGDPIEIVITDDCSPDETYEVIEQTVSGYAGPHKLVLNRNPSNLGLAGNVHKAHEISSGDVIIAAAGDDVSLPDRAAKIRTAFYKHHPLLVCSYADVIDPSGKPVDGNFRTASFYNSFDLEKAARSKSLYIGATGAWHRSLYDSFGPIDPEAYEDLVMGFRAALEGKVHVIEEALVKYRLGQGITSSDLFFKDISQFENRRQKSFIANRAIMRQRMADTKASGIEAASEILGVLAKEITKSELGIAFYEPDRTNFRNLSLRHPLLALYTWHSERRRIRKMQDRISKAVSNG
ncbi:MAG: glycosyltransferase [Litoreibacter sp.]|nr:glycosyltransferase [Litoreibacter sp.]